MLTTFSFTLKYCFLSHLWFPFHSPTLYTTLLCCLSHSKILTDHLFMLCRAFQPLHLPIAHPFTHRCGSCYAADLTHRIEPPVPWLGKDPWANAAQSELQYNFWGSVTFSCFSDLFCHQPCLLNLPGFWTCFPFLFHLPSHLLCQVQTKSSDFRPLLMCVAYRSQVLNLTGT